MLTWLIAWCLTPQNDRASFETLKHFDVTSMPVEETIVLPSSIDFDAEGGLYVLDRNTSRIHIWNPDGSYKKSFGRSGQGPGEFSVACRLAVVKDELWVLDNFRKMLFAFTLDGVYRDAVRTPGYNYKNFARLGKNTLLPYSTSDGQASDDERIAFSLYAQDKEIKKVISFKTDSVAPDDSYAAYGADYDLQRDPQGDLYLSFSTEPKLYKLDENGNIVSTKTFPLPTRPPNDYEVQMSKEVTWLRINGTVGTWEGFVKLDYTKPMAYFTHFLLKGDKVAFILTPIGGYIGLPHGYSYGSYKICDFKSGRLISTGAYQLPQGSYVFYRNGKMVLFYMSETSEDFAVQEVTLSGL